MLSLLAVVVLFHLSIMIGIIPYEITWGGRLENDAEMYVFESISIVINLVLFLGLLIKGKYVREIIPMRAVNIMLWIFVVIFALNTIGNIFASTNFEKSFSLLTLAFAFLLYMILKKDKKVTSKNI